MAAFLLLTPKCLPMLTSGIRKTHFDASRQKTPLAVQDLGSCFRESYLPGGIRPSPAIIAMNIPHTAHSHGLKNSRKAGMSLVEVMIAATITAILLMATAATFFGNMKAVGTAKSITSGTIFLESVQENIEAQPYQNLLALNGNLVFDEDDAASSLYRAEITTFQSGIGIIQISVSLVNIRSNIVLGRLVTVRSDA